MPVSISVLKPTVKRFMGSFYEDCVQTNANVTEIGYTETEIYEQR